MQTALAADQIAVSLICAGDVAAFTTAHRPLANGDSNTITPIKTAGNKALKPVKVGKQPDALVFTPGGRTLYVIDYTSDDGPGFITPVRTCVGR